MNRLDGYFEEDINDIYIKYTPSAADRLNPPQAVYILKN